MSYTSLLDDLCDIYHLKVKENGGGFGLPDEEKEYHSDVPDLENIPCHFNATNIMNMQQGSPQNDYPLEKKLNLPIGTDIKSVDMVVNKANGVAYIAGIPDSIRNHHITVMLKKKEEYL